MHAAPNRATRGAHHVLEQASLKLCRDKRVHREPRLTRGAATQDAKVAGLAATRPHAATGILKIRG